jgi:hypothetical protein
MEQETIWSSQRGYARHRGVTPRAVAKAIEAGRVTAVKRDERGRVIGIDAARADLEWLRNTDPVEAAKNGKTTTVPPGAASIGISPGDVSEARVSLGPDGLVPQSSAPVSVAAPSGAGGNPGTSASVGSNLLDQSVTAAAAAAAAAAGDVSTPSGGASSGTPAEPNEYLVARANALPSRLRRGSQHVVG